MKHTIFIGVMVSLMGIFFSCSENEISSFHGKQQIYFNKFYMNAVAPGTELADSTVESFMAYPEGTTEIKAKVVVNISGVLPTEDVKFQLRAIPEGTTAMDNEYRLDEFYTFRARTIHADAVDIRDTIGITLIKSDRLDALGETGTRLMVELVPNEQVDLGQFERRRAVIVWKLYPTRPSWWDPDTEIGTEVIWSLLGEYDSDKYILFLQHADVNGEMSEELIQNNPSRARELVEVFKKWLIDNLYDPEKGAEYKRMLDSLKV